MSSLNLNDAVMEGCTKTNIMFSKYSKKCLGDENEPLQGTIIDFCLYFHVIIYNIYYY